MTATARSFPAILRVRARHLDFGTVEVVEVRVDAPCDAPGQRAQLEREVLRAHPNARFKSFAGSVASYLTPEHLVVAEYEAVGPATAAPSASAVPEHPSLFAA